jgi:hypothetical protein
MSDVFVPGYQDGTQLFKQVMGQFGAPAYMRRARRAEDLLESILELCRARYEEELIPIRSKLAHVEGLAKRQNDVALMDLVGPLCSALKADTIADDVSVAKPAGAAARQMFAELCDSIGRFNRRWAAFLAELDLAPVNDALDKYNRYYVFEKECAVGSLRVARQGFRQLPPLTVKDLSAQFPTLPALVENAAQK